MGRNTEVNTLSIRCSYIFKANGSDSNLDRCNNTRQGGIYKKYSFYSKTNQMHNISNLFYFGTTLYMFRTVFPSIIRRLRLYMQHHTIQVLWLLA